MDQVAISNLQKYLQIRTVQPNPAYQECCSFLEAVGADLNLKVSKYEIVQGKPIVIMTLIGKDSSLPSLLLNSHTDVVPVTIEKWSHDPFSADIVDGKIYARGSQDMKSIGMAYVEAIRRLQAQGHVFKRTVHLSFVPDEEIGGADGMEAFVKTKAFEDLNVGFILDEGLPTPYSKFLLFSSERAPWWIKVTATGNAGHGSVMLQGTAVERLLMALEKVGKFRTEQTLKLAKSDDMIRDTGRITSVNITILQAGKQTNVIPDEAIANLDIRVAMDLGEGGVVTKLEEWFSGQGLSYSFIQRSKLLPETNTDKSNNPWWSSIHEALSSLYINGVNYSFEVTTFPGATDARFVREAGIPAIGFSPFRNTPLLLHNHDEYLGINEYLEGISIYEALITNLTS